MKILVLTDIHGAYDLAAEIMKKESADVLVIGGDLTTVGSVGEAERAIERFRKLSRRLCCVAGNMDLPEHDELFVRAGVSIDGRGIVIDHVGFFGVSAAPVSPLHTPYEISEEEIARRSMKGYAEVKHTAVKIFVPHAPPYGTKVDIIHSGVHVGSLSVREFIEENEPDAVSCGHIHEARGQDKLGKTKIVNCGPAAKGYYAIIKVHHETEITNHQHHLFTKSSL